MSEQLGLPENSRVLDMRDQQLLVYLAKEDLTQAFRILQFLNVTQDASVREHSIENIRLTFESIRNRHFQIKDPGASGELTLQLEALALALTAMNSGSR